MNIFFKISIYTLLFTLLTSCAADPDSNDHGFTGVADGEYDNSTLSWSSANLTWYESYPDPGSDDCLYYNGCTWAGQLAYFGGAAKSKTWVKNTNIIAVHSDDWNQYIGKILRIKNGSNQIDAMVYDLCSDADCDGCCTRNMSQTGFLIDMEINTFNRYGGDDGVVEWACLDCN